MAIGRLFVCGMLILAVAFIGQVALHPVPLAVAQGGGDSGQTQGARIYYQYFPIVGRDYCSNCYYVDSIRGSDTNPGTSPASAWRTLAPVQAMQFEPGDVVHFKRGCTWSGGLVIDDDGEESNPITFTAYGDGDRPTITNPGDEDRWTNGIVINANWVTVEDLLVRNVHRYGVRVTGDHNVIRNMDITDTGIGVSLRGPRNLVTENYIHDLHMVKNTPGGDDDFGAVGIWFHNSYNEASHNRVERCRAPSFDYGIGGGAFEWFGDTDGNSIHHNWAADNDGFLEVGGGSCKDTVVAYNMALNNGVFSWIHLSGPFASEVENFRVEHNTIVEIVEVEGSGHLFNFHREDEVTEDVFVVRNNIIYVEELWSVSTKSSFAHNNNLYYLGSGRLGFPLGHGEQIADPIFVNPAEDNFRLQPWSPAIDAGVNLGYSRDLEGNTVPVNAAPDLGAFEYPSVPEQPPTPTPVPSPTPLPTPNPNEIIVNDTDLGFSTSFSQDAWQQYTYIGGQHYGATHCYNKGIGTGEDTATWSFTIPLAGRYEVYAWWWEGSWRPTDVPYTVNHLDGSTTVRVDQQDNGGQWNLLGDFEFQGQGSVMLSDDVSSGGDVVADAVRLVYVGP